MIGAALPGQSSAGGPESLPADPRQLRAQLKDFTPAMAGVQPSRWRNIWSLTGLARYERTRPLRFSDASPRRSRIAHKFVGR